MPWQLSPIMQTRESCLEVSFLDLGIACVLVFFLLCISDFYSLILKSLSCFNFKLKFLYVLLWLLGFHVREGDSPWFI